MPPEPAEGHQPAQAAAPAATTPAQTSATPPADTTPPAKAEPPPWIKSLGLATGEIEPEPPKEQPQPTLGVTLGEHTRMLDEDAAAKAKAADAPAEPPKEGDAPPATPAPATAPTTPPAAPPAQTPATPPPAKKVEVAKKQTTKELLSDISRNLEAKIDEKLATAQPPAAPAAPASQPDPFEATLSEAQKDELDLAKYAASKNEKHKDLPAKLMAFYRKLDDFASRVPRDMTPQDQEQEIKRFIQQNQPVLDQYERRKIEREKLTEEVRTQTVREVESKQEGKLRELEMKTRQLEAKPVIEKVANDYRNGLTNLLESDQETADMAKKAKTDGWDKVKEENPLYGEIAHNLVDTSIELAKTYMSLRQGVEPFDAKNGAHQTILEFIKIQGEEFAARGGNDRVRDGKQFLPVSKYNELAAKNPAAAQAYWTFNDRDVLTRLAYMTKAEIQGRVRQEEERLKKAGYVRAPKQPEQAKPATPPASAIPQPEKKEAPASPKSTSTAAPGAAQTKPIPASTVLKPSEFAALGLPAVK